MEVRKLVQTNAKKRDAAHAASNNSNLENAQVLQSIMGFSVVIILSLCTIVVNSETNEHHMIKLFLWLSAGCFAAAAIRQFDRVFDKKSSDEELIMLKHKSNSGAARSTYTDGRWKNISFILFMIGWICFLGAYFNIDLAIFSVSNWNQFFDNMSSWNQFINNIWCIVLTIVMAAILLATTLLAMTKKFFGIE